MECKDEYARRMHYRIRIKVEPYWNVKKFDSDTNTYTAKIKVEPYWNVKTLASEIISDLEKLK